MLRQLETIYGAYPSDLPLEVGQAMTVPRELAYLEGKLKEIINEINLLENNDHNYTDEAIRVVNEKLEELKDDIRSGRYIEDGSISMSKLDQQLVDDLHSLMIRQLNESAKLVIPTIDETGHYCLEIPNSWTQVNFEFLENGHLDIIVLDD